MTSEFIRLSDVNRLIDEEIKYLEDHVKRANEGIEINKERVESWIFEAKQIKGQINRLKGKCPVCGEKLESESSQDNEEKK